MNDKADFIKQVERHLPPGLESVSSYIPDVVSVLEDVGLINYDYPKQYVGKVIELLPRWYVHQRGRAGKDTSESEAVIEGRMNANALLNGEFLAELIRPRIKAIRKGYFDSEEPPFASLKEAIEWYGPIKAQLIRQTYDMAVLGYRERDLEYVSEAADRWWYDVEKPLLALSRGTGIEQESLVFYVLADIKPLAVPYEITMPGKEYCKGRRRCYYVNIKVNTELGFDDLFAIYRTVKEALGVKRGRRFDEQHLELYDLVQDRGGPIAKGAVNFWKSILQEWDFRHPGDYKEWRSIRRAYDRLSKKLNAQYQIADNQDVLGDLPITTVKRESDGTVVWTHGPETPKESEVNDER